jgi:hypothetical protein
MFPMRATSAAAPQSTTGIMIPLYTYPGGTWTNVISVQEANPGVPVVAIINPDSGPGAGSDPNYVSGILSLQAAGVTVIGYVPTGYGSTSISAVEAMVNDYKSWYPVTGIFFDEMSNVAGYEGYYSTLNAYAQSLGFTYTVGNPGADTIPAYIGTVDTIVIYENQGLPSISNLEGWHSGYAKDNFAMMAYGVQSVNGSYPSAASPHVGYIYITNAQLPNPYDALPPYLAAVASALQTAAAGSSSTTTTTATSTTSTASTAPAIMVNVTSVSVGGYRLDGSWTVVQAGTITVAQGYAPLVFNASLGATYTVAVANYGHYAFQRWGDNSTSPVVTLTPTGATALSATFMSTRRR